LWSLSTEHRPPEIIETQRLRLREPRPDDAEAIHRKYGRDPEVARYVTWRPDQSLDQLREFVATRLERWGRGEGFAWVVTVRGDDTPIGMVELRPQRRHMAEVSYVVSRRFWNRGYATEAVGAVVRWAMAQPVIYRVWAVCDVENTASARVLEKVGMEREGILRRWIVHPNISNEPRDCYCYSIVKSPAAGCG
jgi:RimJ/RimL family protein N-acetyltransferase